MQISLGNLLKDHRPMSVVQMLIFYVRCISSKSRKWISNFPQRKFIEYTSAFRALSSEQEAMPEIKEGSVIPQNKESQGIKNGIIKIFFKGAIYKSNELEKIKDNFSWS